MSFNALRICKNAAGDVIRADTLAWTATSNPINTGIAHRTYARNLKTQIVSASNVADRVVAVIELLTDADTIDSSNYAFVRWTRSTGIINGDMSDLPAIGATV